MRLHGSNRLPATSSKFSRISPDPFGRYALPSILPPAPAARVPGALPLLKQVLQRAPLHGMLLGVGLLELLQVDQLPANRRQTPGLGQADKAEVGCGIVEGEQKIRDFVVQPRPDVGV